MFRMILALKINYLPKQHKLIGLFNIDVYTRICAVSFLREGDGS